MDKANSFEIKLSSDLALNLCSEKGFALRNWGKSVLGGDFNFFHSSSPLT